MAISIGAGMAIAAALAAAGKMYSGYAASNASQAAANDQYIYNMALQKQAQAWQEKMVNTAHQREVADLKLAGLNPILSAGGNGASAGSAGTNSVAMDNRAQGIEQATSGMSDFVNAMIQSRANDINQQNADTQQGLANSEKIVKEQQAELVKNQAQNELIDGQIKNQQKLQEIIRTEWLPKSLKKDLERQSSEISRNLADTIKSRAEAIESRARTTSEKVRAKQIEEERKTLELENIKRKNQAQSIINHPMSASWARNVGVWTEELGKLLGGNAGFSYTKK